MHSNPPSSPGGVGITALLGPTNTGKTHRAIEQLLSHRSGMIGFPLRLLAREVYDRITARIGEREVALVTGEEKRIPPRPRYWICTVESMPVDREVDFVCIDEIQLATHRQRGHTFTERLLHARGVRETWFLGSDAMQPIVEALVPTALSRRHPRFSKLSYGGVQSLGSLPPRTAVVAFSVPEVYELAERLRQRHGGTAVVLGALSPRARNAQVAMYESGEVEYMVATDAIGMGLNLDLDRVVFASTGKFDGRQSRSLFPAELGQIAGRAGRYTRDGSFAVLRPSAGLDPDVVHAIENHRFEPIRRVVWRNHELDFDTIEDLVASLRGRPRRGKLRMLERADDFDALTQLTRLSSVRKRARGPEAVALLWDVCRIPDFRKLMLESHVQLLARVYDQLSGPTGRLDEAWMSRRIQRLDDVGGDIDTLMTRMAFIRTWTYVANHEHWVPNAERWQERTREIEDRQSDALHQRLTERFVARSVGTPHRAAGRRRAPPARAAPSFTPDPSNPFAALAGLEVAEPETSASGSEAAIQRLVEAEHEAFRVDAHGRLQYDEQVVGRWHRGSDLLHPDVRVSMEGATAGTELRVRRRLQAWTVDAVEELVGPLRAFESSRSAAVRGLAYQLRQGLGTVSLRRAGGQVERLQDADRSAFRAAGVEVGRVSAYVVSGLRPGALTLRHALYWVHAPWDRAEQPWNTSAASWPLDVVPSEVSVGCLGFIPLGPRAVRADVAERAAKTLHEHADAHDPFVAPDVLGSWLGCRRRHLTAILRDLGYWRIRGREYSRTRPRRNRRRS